MKPMIILALASIVLLLAACGAQKIADVKQEGNVGKTVTVKGTVENTLKIGDLSGYTIKDETGTIGVSTLILPKEGDTVTAKGVLMKDSIFGYYIKNTEYD
jgi:hypothetical protein